MTGSIPLFCTVLAGLTAGVDFQLEKLWDIQSPEQMQEQVQSGYPMPWLAEVLSDSTIPAVDRYWLDCRMRAAIARDLHLFFDREGNSIVIEADFIKPGDMYWRENFIVNPVGEPFRYANSDLPTTITSEPGVVLNVYGEQVGEIATSSYDLIFLSRDTSVGIGRSGYGSIALDFACFLYPDGGFLEVDIDDVFVQYSLSEDGNVAVYYSRYNHDDDSPLEHMLYAFDSRGNLIFERLMPSGSLSGSARPAVSPDNRYIATGLANGEIWLLDAGSGATIHSWGGEERMSSSILQFSPDSRYLCASGGSARVFDCASGEVVWEQLSVEEGSHGSLPYTLIAFEGLSTTNDASLFGLICCTYEANGLRYSQCRYATQVYTCAGEMLLNYQGRGIPWFSPSGCILLLEPFAGIVGGGTSTPLVLIRISQTEV